MNPRHTDDENTAPTISDSQPCVMGAKNRGVENCLRDGWHS